MMNDEICPRHVHICSFGSSELTVGKSAGASCIDASCGWTCASRFGYKNEETSDVMEHAVFSVQNVEVSNHPANQP